MVVLVKVRVPGPALTRVRAPVPLFAMTEPMTRGAVVLY